MQEIHIGMQEIEISMQEIHISMEEVKNYYAGRKGSPREVRNGA